jgi:hypothetical protein
MNSYGFLIGLSPPNDGWHSYFSGSIDEVYAYDRALGQDEIQQLMNTGIPEPSSILAVLCGIGGMGGLVRRRKT